MTALGIFLFFIAWWAWFCPHEVGVWLEKVKDPYRERPRHHKK